MKTLTQEELQKLLSTGDFENLIGTVENDFFDCKNVIYHLKHEENKRELAKDGRYGVKSRNLTMHTPLLIFIRNL